MEDQANIWILLADTRKKLLWLWLIFTAIILVFFLFMTVVNTFEGVEIAAWLWAFISLFPMLAFLFIGVAQNPNPSKVIKKTTFFVIFWGALVYLLFLLSVFLGLQAWLDAHTEGSISDYFNKSYWVLLPFQILLLWGVWILYFEKTKLIQPNEKILLGYAQKKAEYAKRFGSLTQQDAFDLLLKNKMPALFELLRLQLKSKAEQNDVILLENTYNRIKQTHDLDTEDPAVLQRELNRISKGLIDIIETI